MKTPRAYRPLEIPIEDLGYMAGIFDSEGCVSIHRYRDSGCYLSSLAIQMCDKEPLLPFISSFDGKIYLKDGSENKNRIYLWQMRGRKMIPVAQKLLPLLRIKRKYKALECALKCAEIRDKKEQSKLWEQCKNLNAGSERQVSLKYTQTIPTEEELHYMAGMWDGDGSACILKQRAGFGESLPTMVIEMCDTEALVLFKSRFGGWLRKSGRHKQPLHSQSYRWEITGKPLIPVAELLLPLLRIPRKAKAMACVLECAKLKSHPGRARHGVPYHILREREELREKCILLNKRGSEKIDADIVEVTITPTPQLTIWD